MLRPAVRSDLLLLLTSMIWGFSFVAQRQGMEFVGPFIFNGVRFALGSLSLVPLILVLHRRKKTHPVATAKDRQPAAPVSVKSTLLCSLGAGMALFSAASLQQLGIMYTSAGKAGFITGLYVVLVPLFGILLGKKTGSATWVGAFLAAAGLYFLSAVGSRTALNPGDILVAFSAIFWSIHVLLIDAFVRRIDALKLSALQFAWCSLFSLIGALLFEHIQIAALLLAAKPILYGGLGSVGIAYTLQVIAQKDAAPAHSAIILCLEGVFATLGGMLLLSEVLDLHGVIGSLLMLSAMLATQWEVIGTMKRKKTEY